MSILVGAKIRNEQNRPWVHSPGEPQMTRAQVLGTVVEVVRHANLPPLNQLRLLRHAIQRRRRLRSDCAQRALGQPAAEPRRHEVSGEGFGEG